MWWLCQEVADRVQQLQGDGGGRQQGLRHQRVPGYCLCGTAGLLLSIFKNWDHIEAKTSEIKTIFFYLNQGIK